MREWYIVCFTQGKELSKWMKDGWTGQESHWGWQAGDLRLELKQIQARQSRWVSESGRGGNRPSSEVPHRTCRYWFMFHCNFTDSKKHGRLHNIWPQTSQGGDFCWKLFWEFFFFFLLHFTFKQVTFFSLVQLYLCRQKAMIAINHLLPRAVFETLRSPFSMAEAVTSRWHLISQFFGNWIIVTDIDSVRGRKNIWEAGQTSLLGDPPHSTACH